MLTECLANTNNWLTIFGEEHLSTNEAQLEYYRRILPILVKSRLGWYAGGSSPGICSGHLLILSIRAGTVDLPRWILRRWRKVRPGQNVGQRTYG